MRLLHFKAAGWLAIFAGAALGLAATGEKVELTKIEWQAITLVKLLPYVKWSERSLPEGDAEFVVGVLGADPFDGLLQELAKNTKVHGREVRVKIVDPLAPPGKLEVLFVPESRAADWQDYSRKLDRFGILTVGTAEDFTRSGGVFNFRPKDRKLIVNIQNANKAGLSVDSKLLSICIRER